MTSESGVKVEWDGKSDFIEDGSKSCVGKTHGGEEDEVAHGGSFGTVLKLQDEDPLNCEGYSDGMEGFISVRSPSDSIFEADGDEDEGYYPIPEVVMGKGYHKRKQDIEIRSIPIAYDFIPVDSEEAAGKRRRKQQRENRPLYLLNPDDYNHDPVKQLQIRRATITYQHHQRKRNTIIQLTAENRRLRGLCTWMRSLMIKMKKCKCGDNNSITIPKFESVIPEPPPKKPKAKCSPLKTTYPPKPISKGSSRKNVPGTEGSFHRPLVNIKSSHFRSLGSKGFPTGTADQVLIPRRAAPTVSFRSVRTPVINPITGPVTMERPHQRVSIISSQPATISGGFLPVTFLEQASMQLQETPPLGSFSSTLVKSASQLFYEEKMQRSEFAKHSKYVSPGTVNVGRRTTLAVALAESGDTEVEFRRNQVKGVTDVLTASKNDHDGCLNKRKQLQDDTEKTDSSLNYTYKFISNSNLELGMYEDIIFEEVDDQQA